MKAQNWYWEAFVSRGQSIPTCQRMQCTRRSKEEAFPVWVWPDTTYIIIIRTMVIRGYCNCFNRFLSLKWIRNCIRYFEINQKWLRQLSSIFISLAKWYRRFFFFGEMLSCAEVHKCGRKVFLTSRPGNISRCWVRGLSEFLSLLNVTRENVECALPTRLPLPWNFGEDSLGLAIIKW